MSVSLYRHTWGAVGSDFPWQTIPDLMRDAAAEGYTGIELPFGDFNKEPGGPEAGEVAFKAALEETGLAFFPLVSTQSGTWSDYAGHLASFRSQVERAAEWGVSKVCVHAGADSFSDEEAIRFLKEATLIARDLGIEPLYETHRQRPFFNPFRTVKLLEALPDIWLTADFAHWVPVLERLPRDLDDLFRFACSRTKHIHARVSYPEGPQVPDPRDPMWADHLALHETWWDWCVDGAKSRGESIAITPEFGPFPYVLYSPFTTTPIADVADVVAWMRDRLTSRYEIGPAVDS